MASIVSVAVDMRAEHEKAALDYVARATAGQTASGFASVMQSFRKSLSRMFRGK